MFHKSITYSKIHVIQRLALADSNQMGVFEVQDLPVFVCLLPHFIKSCLESKQVPTVVLSGRWRNEDTPSPTVTSVGLLSLQSVKTMIAHLERFATRTDIIMVELKLNLHDSGVCWTMQYSI